MYLLSNHSRFESKSRMQSVIKQGGNEDRNNTYRYDYDFNYTKVRLGTS